MGLKSDFGNNSAVHKSCEFQDVAARGIFELNRGVRIGENAGIAGALEMIKELRRVHGDIVGVVPTSPKTAEKWGTPLGKSNPHAPVILVKCSVANVPN